MASDKRSLFPLLIIGILFFVFGFITWINGILIPYFQICLELSNFESLWVAFASFIAYFFMAIPSAFILKKTGYRRGMVVGLLVMAVGTLLFLPAAYARHYGLFLTGLFVTGAGLALLQTAANPYVARIGPIESTARRTSFMGLANKIAGILSQRILGAVFLLNADAIIANVNQASAAERARILDAFSLKVVTPYTIISVLLLLLAVLIYFANLPEINEQDDDPATGTQSDRPTVLHYPYLVLGVLTLFFSEGCEVIAIDGIILYGRALGIPIGEARFFTEYTLGAMLVGYVLGTLLIPNYLRQHRALQLAALFGFAMTVGAFLTSGLTSVYFMALIGIGSALFWGTIWGLSIRSLGRFTKVGSAYLIMAVCGGALLPLLFGRLIDLYPQHPQNALLMLLPCFAVLFAFSTWGYRLESWTNLLKSSPQKSTSTIHE